MARLPRIAQRTEQLLGCAVVSTAPVAGGHVCTTTKMRLSDGRMAAAKTRHQPPPGFFASEAAGLRWLAEAEAIAVPEVLAVAEDCLIIEWIEPGRPSAENATALGHDLARLHSFGVGQSGAQPSGGGQFGAERDGFIGVLPLPNRPAETWVEFYAVRRVLPYLKLAVDRGQIDPVDATDVELAVRRLTQIAGPPEPPARLHGDLWNGNVVWDHAGVGHLIDPAAYAGHRETDLAMLALFGLPQLPRVMEAYQEVAPLAEGWQDRVALHQLFPLLVHACLFGGSYGSRAGEAARRYL